MTDTLDQRLAAAAEWCRQRPEAAHIAAVIDEARGERPTPSPEWKRMRSWCSACRGDDIFHWQGDPCPAYLRRPAPEREKKP